MKSTICGLSQDADVKWMSALADPYVDKFEWLDNPIPTFPSRLGKGTKEFLD